LARAALAKVIRAELAISRGAMPQATLYSVDRLRSQP